MVCFVMYYCILCIDIHTTFTYFCTISPEIRQRRYGHAVTKDPYAYGRDTRYKESPPDHDRQKLLAASKDIYSQRQSTTPSSGNRSTSTQRDIHSAHEAMINDQMV